MFGKHKRCDGYNLKRTCMSELKEKEKSEGFLVSVLEVCEDVKALRVEDGSVTYLGILLTQGTFYLKQGINETNVFWS